MPSSNGIGTARAVARLYGAAAAGGAELGLSEDVFGQLTGPATPPSGGTCDKVTNIDVTYSLGVNKPLTNVKFESSDKAFGTPGFGGSFGFADPDPDTGVGFAYAMNRLGFHLVSDPRELALRRAVFCDVLGARPQS